MPDYGLQEQIQGADPLRIAWFGHARGRRADGLATYSAQTVAALGRLGAEVRFFHHDVDGAIAPTPDSVVLRGLRFKTLTISRLGSRAETARALAEFRPHVVHCSWSFSLLDGWIAQTARRIGAVSVATFHLPYADPATARGRVMKALYRYHRKNLNMYDHCIALSAMQRQLLMRIGIPQNKLSVMANAVDVDEITPGKSTLKEELNARFLVVYMGRLDPEKRVGALIDAFCDLQWPEDHVLAIAGNGSVEHKLRRRAHSHPNVRFLGMVHTAAERNNILRGADVFVLPSTAEGLALSLLEAMAAGCAIVATDTGEDAAALGDSGIVIPVRPLQPHLSNALQELRADAQRRRTLGEEARRRAQQHFSLTTQAEQILKLYAALGVSTSTGSATMAGNRLV